MTATVTRSLDPFDRLRAAAQRVLSGTRVLVAYAHGSRVAGRPRPESDLDVGYYLKGYREGETLSLREELGLEAALSEAAGADLDLRNLAEAPLELRGRVLEHGVRIFSADDPERVALERYLLAHYHDYKETFRRMHEIRLRELARRGF
jgi:predicted nucleotidyltransferase